MTKIFNYRAGSFINQVSKTVITPTEMIQMTPTDITHRQTEKGVSGVFNGTSSQIDTGISSNDYLIGGFSTHFAIKPYSNGQAGFGRIWSKRGGSPSNGISVNMNAGRVEVYNISSLFSSIIPFRQWSFFTITVEPNGNATIYINGQLDGSGNIGVLDGITTTVNLLISNQDGTTRSFDGEIKSIKINSTVCSATEVQKEYEEFLNASPTGKEIRGFEYPKPTEINHPNATFATNGIISNGTTLVDITGNGNNLTNEGNCISTSKGFETNGTTNYFFSSFEKEITDFTIAYYGTVKSASSSYAGLVSTFGSTARFSILFETTGQIRPYLRNNSGSITLQPLTTQSFFNKRVSIVLTKQGNDVKLFIDGVQVLDVNPSNLDIGELSVETLELGRFLSNGNVGAEFEDVRIFDKGLSADEVKAYHNEMTKPYILEDFLRNPVGDTNPKGWNKGTGNFEVREIPPLQYSCDLSVSSWQRCADNTGDNLGANGVGQALKELGLGSGVGEGTDLVGFNADLPGYRSSNGSFHTLGGSAHFWSSSEDGGNAWRRRLYSSNSSVGRLSSTQALGFSVRCLRNTDDTSDFIDSRDGNVYECVKIGNQVWMKRNLAYLPEITPEGDWGSSTEPQYAVYDYTGTSVEDAKATANYQEHGVLYNWDGAMEACPDGWRVPSDEELNELELATLREINKRYFKYLECTSSGTIIINADLDSFIDNGYIEIDRWNGTSWTTHKSTVSDLTSESWFDYSNKKITLTATTGDRFANLKVYNGVKL